MNKLEIRKRKKLKPVEKPHGGKLERSTTKMVTYNYAPPTKANIILEATQGGPALAGMIARLLKDAGADVTLLDNRISLHEGTPNLKGLRLNMARVVWINGDSEISRDHQQNEYQIQFTTELWKHVKERRSKKGKK